MQSTEREVCWERMFPDELELAFLACPTLYYAYGMCEPHGPHNTLGLDSLKAHALACRAAHADGGIVAPPDYWHIHELGGYAGWSHQEIGQVDRTWLTAVPPWIHFRNVLYHIRAADALGFHAVILLTGHYGPNWEDLKTLIDLVQPFVAARLYGLPDFEANQPGFDRDGQSGADHAGRVETSLLWALEPDCVDISRLPAPDAPGPHFAMGRTAAQSDRRVGERMAVDEVRWLTKKARELRAAYDPNAPRLLTFADAERVWADVILPALPQFRSMQPHWGEHLGQDSPEGGPPVGSRWRENWPVPMEY